MAQKVRSGKVNLNFAVTPAVAAAFRDATRSHLGKLSLCFEAAMAMWLAAGPDEQGRWLKRVFEAGVDDAVAQMLEQIRAERSEKVPPAATMTPPKGKRT